jgi:hypothetical protein
MEMRIILLNLMIISSIFFQSCNGKDPIQNDIVGIWHSPDGCVLDFRKNGTFAVTYFPAEFVLLPKNEYKKLRFDGTGTWLLRSVNSNWEVYLDFKQVSDKRCSSAFPLLIAGEKGIWENKPPWYLFVWKEEEGGERYTFTK